MSLRKRFWSLSSVIALAALAAGCNVRDLDDAADGGSFVNNASDPDSGNTGNDKDSGEPSEGQDATVSPEADAGEDAAVVTHDAAVVDDAAVVLEDASIDAGNDDDDAGTDAAVIIDEDAGDDDDAGTEPQAPLEIEGRWHSNYGGVETIGDNQWSSYGHSSIIEYDNQTNSLITRTPATAKYGPNLYSKIIWTEIEGGAFYYCTVDYYQPTLEAVRNSTGMADPSGVNTTGCGGYPWTQLSTPIAIEGRHYDNDGHFQIDSDMWLYEAVSLTVVDYDNATRSVILKGEDLKYNKLIWTEPKDGGFWVCPVETNVTKLEDVTSSTKIVYADDLTTGCNDGPWHHIITEPEIEGRHHNDYGSFESVDSEIWDFGYSQSEVIEYDNARNTMITRNSPEDFYFPNKFSKIVWTEPMYGTFYYCTVDFGLDTLGMTRHTTKTAEAADLAHGCGGFSWSRLSPALEITGRWHSGAGGIETLDSDSWASDQVMSLVDYDNHTNTAIMKNAADAEENPNKFNKIVWTEIDQSSTYYCAVAEAQASAQAARDALSSADDTDLASGCDGAAWTKLSPPLEVEGTWTEGAAALPISSEAWGLQSIVSYDNAKDAAITRNPDSESENALKYNKIVWTGLTASTFFYCFASHDQNSAALAESAATVPIKTNLETGCNSGPWTSVSQSTPE